MTKNRCRVRVLALLVAGLSCFIFFDAMQAMDSYSSVCEHPDLFAYWTANSVFLSGNNPFDEAALEAAQNKYCAFGHVLPVWNPPLFFTSVGLLIQLLGQIPYLFAAIIFSLCAIALFSLGTALSTQKTFRLTDMLIVVGLSAPLLFQIKIGQISSLLGAVVFAGLLLTSKRLYFAGGAFFGLSLIKPHLFLIPALWLVSTHYKKKLSVIIPGAVIAAFFFSAMAEWIQPGIHRFWLQREQWPTEVFGSGLSNTIKIFVPSTRGSITPVLISLALGIVLYFAAAIKIRANNSNLLLMLAITLNPLFAPYGFVFDQVLLITAQGYLLSESNNTSTHRKYLGWFTVANLVSLLSDTLPGEWRIAGWNIVAVATLLCILHFISCRHVFKERV